MSAQQSSILIVDDDAHLRETLQDLLELEGRLCVEDRDGVLWYSVAAFA